MLRGGSSETNDGTWNGASTRTSWREVDGDLRAIAKQRGAFDADEAMLLRAAVRMEIWHELGKASLLEYLEEVLGYSPRTAAERVRVARALAQLPALAEALASGELHWSAVRELTRIVTPATEAEWLADVRGKNLREIEHAVASRKRGDKPTDPEEPDLRPRSMTMMLRPATIALKRQVEQILADERGEYTDDDGVLAAAFNAFIDSGLRDTSASGENAATTGRARYQILTVVCSGCGQGFQDAGGRRMPIERSDVERAECDAQRIDSDAAPGRAAQDVSPMVQRFVRRRDGGKCCVPGCRSARFLEIHHVVRRVDGGSHDADNLTLLCDGHHKALHEGKLTITGKAPKLEVRWMHRRFAPAAVARSNGRELTHVGNTDPCQSPNAARSTHVGDADPYQSPNAARLPHVGDADTSRGADRSEPRTQPAKPVKRPVEASRFAITALKIEVKQALVKMRFKKDEAMAAVEAAASKLGDGATLETLLFASLQHCPKPYR